jgi:hypothetical protein
MDISNIGRIFIIFGIILISIGGLLIILDHVGYNKWNIPGDIRIEFGSTTCVIALGTSILLSILLSIILNILFRLKR